MSVSYTHLTTCIVLYAKRNDEIVALVGASIVDDDLREIGIEDVYKRQVQTHECLLDGESVSLTPTEFSILHVLLSNAGNVVSIEELFLSLIHI